MRGNTTTRAFFTAVMAMMLAAQSTLGCTGIMLTNSNGSFVHGRTVEFGTNIDSSIAVVPRGLAFTGKTPRGDGLEYTAKYAAVGAIAFTDIKLLDGLNEQGLAVGAFYFPGFTAYTPLTNANQTKGLSPGDFPNWQLTQFSSVAEVRSAIERGEAIITPTVIENCGPEAPPFHYVVYDRTGASIAIEPIGGRLAIHDNPLGVMTNSPSFDWHMTNLRNYISMNPQNAPELEIDGESFAQLGQGSGMIGLPGDFKPPSRFVREAIFSKTAVPSKTAQSGVEQIFYIHNNFDIPVGVSRTVSDQVVHTEYTMLTVAWDPQSLRYYYRSYADQTIRMIDLKQHDPNAQAIMLISTTGQQPIVDMTKQVK